MAGFLPDPGADFTVGQEPAIARALNALGQKLGVTIYGISGYRSPAHSVAVGGSANDPHTRGEAADIGVGGQTRISAAELTNKMLASVGLYRPFDPTNDPSNPEVNHVQLLANAANNQRRSLQRIPSYVPQQYKNWVAQAATGTGLPTTIVAAQIDMESGFNPKATSSTGAQGMAQFEPSTFAGLGIKGSPYDPGVALQAYTKEMGDLLRQYNGNIRNALAAYNAGSGNIAAGYGYADSIIGRAGVSSNATSGVGTGTGAFTRTRPGGQSSGDTPGSPLITDFAALEGVPRTAPANAPVDVAYGTQDVSFWGTIGDAWKWYWKPFDQAWTQTENRIHSAEKVITGPVDFMDAVAKFILNPLAWLRAVEFITGFILMLVAMQHLLPRNRGSLGTAQHISRSVVNATPIGREMRIATGRRMGRREGQREAARMQARREETREERTASANERARITREARQNARAS